MEEIKDTEELERELLTILVLSKDAYPLIQLKSKHFSNKDLARLFDYCMESLKNAGAISPAIISQSHNDFNVDLYMDIISNSMFLSSTWKNQLEYCQTKIFQRYKMDFFKKLSTRLEDGKIDYDEFVQKVKEIDKINIITVDEERMKTISNIDLTYTEQTFIKSNVINFDKKTNGFALGEMTVWSGSNGSAKSTFLGQVAIEAINQGYNVAMFSGELTDKRLLNWLCLQSAGKSRIKKNEEKNYYYVDQYYKDKILHWLDNKLYIYDNTFGNKANEILQSVRDCIDKHDIKMVILDNLMSMNLASYGDQKYDVQTKLVTELSALAKEKNVHIHFVCHPRKSLSFLRKNDISGTADLTNIADNVIIMHRINIDFRIKTKDMFGWSDNNEIYQYTNVIEICKNREYGIEDEFIGLYFEVESKRLLNFSSEQKYYGWIKE